MKKLKSENHTMFQNWSKNMLRYGLASDLGRIVVSENSETAFYELGNFLFLAGRLDADFWKEYKEKIGLAEKILISEDKNWQDYLEKEQELISFTRYAFSNQASFSRKHLEEKLRKLPSEDQIAPMNQDIYDQLGQKDWSRDLQGDFSCFDDFDQSGGFGFVIIRKEEVIAAVSTGLVYKKAIEVEIATSPVYQRQGLALILGAKMVLESLNRGIFPLWDAHNEASKKIAEKLGYHSLASYPAYEWHVTRD